MPFDMVQKLKLNGQKNYIKTSSIRKNERLFYVKRQFNIKSQIFICRKTSAYPPKKICLLTTICLVRFYWNILDICYEKFASKLDVRREITLTSIRGIQIRTVDIESFEKYLKIIAKIQMQLEKELRLLLIK